VSLLRIIYPVSGSGKQRGFAPHHDLQLKALLLRNHNLIYYKHNHAIPLRNKPALEKIMPVIIRLQKEAMIPDSDLARICGIATKALNQAVKRNRPRFPAGFMFRLSRSEFARNRSQIVTGPDKHCAPRSRPFAFIEQSAIMATTRMNVFIVRAFVKTHVIRLSGKGLSKESRELKRKLTERLAAHELATSDVLCRFIKLIEEPLKSDIPQKFPIGFPP
jgi:hypothetical protein